VAAVALAVAVLGARTSHALVDDPFTSYTQPANALLMPYDVTAGHVTFLLVSNVSGGTSTIAAVSSHWSFWSENCDHLADVSICLTLNDTVVVDPTNLSAIDVGNFPVGPVIDLSGTRGFVTVTAYATDETCGDPSVKGFQLVDNAIVGSYTFANTSSGAAFGNDSIGLGVDPTGSFTDLPDIELSPDSTTGFLDIQTFNPATLEDSQVVLLAVRENTGKLAGELGPIGGNVRANVNYYDNLEINTSLPGISIPCALFTSVRNTDDPSLIPSTVTVASSGVVRLTNLQAPGGPVGVSTDTFVYGSHGQAVGQFGGSTNAKYSVLLLQ
jgi:hypothetical protein